MSGVERVAEMARHASLDITAREAALLTEFADLLVRWNSVVNLISKGDEQRVVTRHILDSLTARAWLGGERVVDLGTGAGLPGIPLAITEPGRRFELLDRQAKRLRFVRQAAIELQLKNVDVAHHDMARYRPQTLFDTVVSRAVSEPTKLWELARRMLKPQGRAVFLCGGDAEPPSRLPGARRVRVVDVALPELERRHRLLVIDGAVDQAMEPDDETRAAADSRGADA